MIQRYRSGYGLWVGCGQMVAVIAVLGALTWGVIAFLASFGKDLGW
jgi:hypothetical protein